MRIWLLGRYQFKETLTCSYVNAAPSNSISRREHSHSPNHAHLRRATFTGQSLISHAGLNILTGFMDALGFGGLCENRLGQFVPSGARHRSGKLLGSLATMLAAGGEHVNDLDIQTPDVAK